LVGPAHHFCILSKRTLLPALPLARSSALYLHVPTQIPPPVEHLYPQNLAHSPATTELPMMIINAIEQMLAKLSRRSSHEPQTTFNNKKS